MNVEIRTEASIFLFWEYLFRNFGILSLQCGVKGSNVEEGRREWTEGWWNSWRGFKINFRGGREGNYGKGVLLVYEVSGTSLRE
jgi:hypothetical protein